MHPTTDKAGEPDGGLMKNKAAVEAAAADGLAQAAKVTPGSSTASKKALEATKADLRKIASLTAAEPAEPAPPVEPTPTPTPPAAGRRWGGWFDNGEGDAVFSSTEMAAAVKAYGSPGLVHYGDGLTPSAVNMRAAAKTGTPFLDWGTQVTVAQINAGKYDGDFATIDKEARAYGGEVLFRPLWEMNLAAPPWSSSGRPEPKAYIEAWKRMRSKITAPNLVWVWCPNYIFVGDPSSAPDPTPWYPGADQVDRVGADLYTENWTAAQTLAGITPILEKLGKPAVVGEWGVSASKNQNQAATITELGKLIKANPMWVDFVAFLWNEGGAGDWIPKTAEARAAFNAANAAFAA
jgi:hypothetical protein